MVNWWSWAHSQVAGGQVHLLQHFVEVLLGRLHSRADQGVHVDTGKDLQERKRSMRWCCSCQTPPLRTRTIWWQPSFPTLFPSHRRLSPPPRDIKIKFGAWCEKQSIWATYLVSEERQEPLHPEISNGSYHNNVESTLTRLSPRSYRRRIWPTMLSCQKLSQSLRTVVEGKMREERRLKTKNNDQQLRNIRFSDDRRHMQLFFLFFHDWGIWKLKFLP